MAARKRKLTLSDSWKEKIRASVIIDYLQKHINGQHDMSSTQIKAAEILLRKTIPDLARSEHVDPDGNALVHNVTITVVKP